MFICPECGEEIYYLENVETGCNVYNYDGEGYGTGEFLGDGGSNTFECPECSTVLAINEITAKNYY